MKLQVRELINFGTRTKMALGINAEKGDKGEWKCSYCLIKIDRQLVTLVQSGAGLSLESVFAAVKAFQYPGMRFHLNISGRNVISKELDGELSKQQDILKKNFPFFKEKDFFWQRFESQAQTFLSVYQHSELAVFLEEWKYNLVSISLGPFILNVLGMVAEELEIHFDGYAMTKRDIITWSRTQVTGDSGAGYYVISGQPISGDIAMAYAGALSVFLPASFPGIANQDALEGAGYFRFCRSVFERSRVALLGTLIILAISTLLQMWLQNKVSELGAVVKFNAEQFEVSAARNVRSQQMQQVFSQLGWKENVWPLFYADQLAASRPASITLTRLEIGTPEEKNIREKKDPFFNPDRIAVRGNTLQPAALREWIDSIEKMPWVGGIDRQQYEFNPRENTGIFEFMIVIR